MKLFLVKTISFVTLLILIYFIASIVSYNKANTNDFMEGIIDKHNRIDRISEPKLIFAGGSNIAFGINSPKIEREFNKPVVNLGLHAGLGLSFILEELKYSCKNGDIVFLSIEYFLSLEGDYGLKQLTRNGYSNASKFYKASIIEDIKLHIEHTRVNIKALLFKDQRNNSVYDRNGFNEYGDVISHLKKQQPESIHDKVVFIYKYWEGIETLNEFNNYALHNNIKVFYLYPNYPKSQYEVNRSTILKYANDLSENLKIGILNKPEDFVFDDSLFFDTVYHLNADGREKRTDKLIQIIKDKVL